MEKLEIMESLFNATFKGKKVLITGDTGFKGSWLSIWLLEMGAEVFGYALPPKTPKDNFSVTDLQSKIQHRDGDICDYPELLKFFQQVKPDIAFHLAAQPIVLLSYENPVETFQTNLIGTVNFLEAVRNTPSIKAAVNITSDKCYENQEWVWGYRESDPMGGKDPYSASKGCSELITSSYISSFFRKENSAHVASARAGNVIGGGDWAENRIVPDFFRAHLASRALSVRNPAHTRPWQHVLEPLSGYLWLAARLFNDGKKFSGGWNFGPADNSNYSVGVLVNAIIKAFGNGMYTSPANTEKPHEAHLLKLDISKAVQQLEWNPTLDFAQTVDFTVAGYEAELSGKNLYEQRAKQISEYRQIARTKAIKWTT